MNNNNSSSFFLTEKVPNKHFLRLCVLTLIIFFNASILKAQNVQISLAQNNVELETVLNEIERQTDYLFVYDNNIDVKQKVTVNAQSTSLKNALDVLFRGKNITFYTEGSNIILRLNSNEAVQQNRKTISGYVKDSDGEPLIGVSVVVKGTTIGAVTDLDGMFTLSVPVDAKTLVISYLGMETVETQII